MSIVNTRGLAAVVLGVLGLVAAPAAAQDGMRLARACVQEIQETSENHAETARDITRRTASALRQANRDGAPDRVLKAIAANGVQRLDAVAGHGQAAIHETASACVRRLLDLDASRELIQAVRGAAVSSNQAIDDATRRGKRVIREVLERATG